MVDRQALVRCFEDTQRLCREDPALAEATRRMQSGTQFYPAGYRAVRPERRSVPAPILVAEDTSFRCARSFAEAGERVTVLNFANAYSPGGGVTRGAMAQEECLCRSSNLYAALTLPDMIRDYYRHNAKTTGEMGTDAIIYSPGVTVFKSDDALPVPLHRPFEVDVLTCAAPYINPNRLEPVPEERLEAVLNQRIRNILEVAVANGADTLVLGAFGCGAFNNPPALVAGCFRCQLAEAGYRDYFKRVVFAIKPNNAINSNFRAFAAVFDGV